MNIQISLTDNFSPDILIFHYQLCQLSLNNIVGFINEKEWEEITQHLNESKKEELKKLWTFIKTKNRKKPEFYRLENKEISNGILITKLIPAKINTDGFYCQSLVTHTHECHAIAENPALTQIENINSLSKIFKTQRKKNNSTTQKNNNNPELQKVTEPPKHTSYLKENSSSNGNKKTGYAALKESMLNKQQTNKNNHIKKTTEEFNVWQQGIEKMVQHGKTNPSARGFIAKHMKLFNENIVKNALIALPTPQEKQIMDIYGYLLQIMREEEQKQDKSQKARNRRAGLVI